MTGVPAGAAKMNHCPGQGPPPAAAAHPGPEVEVVRDVVSTETVAPQPTTGAESQDGDAWGTPDGVPGGIVLVTGAGKGIGTGNGGWG